ncbi:hypothetical protein L198_04528 [Cryptococcus wingfieldii CBS 7118]|uniref:Vps72/YL1 C-terminal domain-containing protein n=1 Tax=Cryptococcus wingfieldii CBS 7118 TaxID=1295528 RepID=A0A1E3J4X3_9TREE|nr:hypothetical protein L198_04528 [Cryptococcus wingfieldii CBS 7118]ODN95909.1 hypothetical protein L198_04528 [Cryptococcus wingfieldii CBS 7118]
MEYETITSGRAKRSTAGNRMRELLEKAHQEDDDELFQEVEDDEEFVAPVDQRDVYLDEFADTDDEGSGDDEERALQREERHVKNKEKGKSKALYDPLAKQPKKKKKTAIEGAGEFKQSDLDMLRAEGIDPATMAPSTLTLEIRKRRREMKRQGRSEVRRSNLRASTIKNEAEIIEREKLSLLALEQPGRKGRKSQHTTGIPQPHKRKFTQDELIAEALEEEERNKEALRDWLKKEDEKRMLRKVGRKRVKGPRWTWVSRTVGKLVDEVPEAAKDVEDDPPEGEPSEPQEASKAVTTEAPKAEPEKPPVPILSPSENAPSQYTRNYIILSQIPGGLPAEFGLVLGDHVAWDELKVIPARNRPINRIPPLCPFTGLPARYRHPLTLTPYANAEGYAAIQDLLAERYVWNGEGMCWMGGEEEQWADGMEEVEGWAEAVGLGWRGGEELVKREVELNGKKRGREGEPAPKRGRGRRR